MDEQDEQSTPDSGSGPDVSTGDVAGDVTVNPDGGSSETEATPPEPDAGDTPPASETPDAQESTSSE